MKTIFLLFAFTVIFSVEAQAQNQLGLHTGIGLPVSSFIRIPYSSGIGVGGNLKYLLNNNFSLGASVSYYTLGAKSLYKNAGLGAMKLVPIHANAEYYFGDGNTQPFIGADLGVTVSSISSIDGSFVSSFTDFSFAPIVGVKFGLSDGVDLFGNAKYNVITDSDGGGSLKYVGINLGLLFNLGN